MHTTAWDKLGRWCFFLSLYIRASYRTFGGRVPNSIFWRRENFRTGAWHPLLKIDKCLCTHSNCYGCCNNLRCLECTIAHAFLIFGEFARNLTHWIYFSASSTLFLQPCCEKYTTAPVLISGGVVWHIAGWVPGIFCSNDWCRCTHGTSSMVVGKLFTSFRQMDTFIYWSGG